MLKSILGILVLAGVLAGCNTMAGAGKDVERAGEKVQDTSKDVQRKM